MQWKANRKMVSHKFKLVNHQLLLYTHTQHLAKFQQDIYVTPPHLSKIAKIQCIIEVHIIYIHYCSYFNLLILFLLFVGYKCQRL